MSHVAAEENGEQLYETEPQNQYSEQEDLYQTPEDTAAGGEALVTFVVLVTLMLMSACFLETSTFFLL